MKILHIIDSAGMYGAEVMLLNLVTQQVRMGYGVEIASIGAKGIAEKAIETAAFAQGFAVRKFRMHPGPNWPGALDVLRHARRHRFDILHSHGFKGNILFGMMIPKGIRRLPLVATLHGWTFTLGWSRMKAYQWLDSLSLRFIDRIVLVNRGMLSHPRLRKYGEKRFRIVNNGIAPFPDPLPAAISPSIEHFCKQGYTICALGRLSTEKGFAYLLDALAMLLHQGKDLRLLLVGEGRERNHLEAKIATLGIGSRVLMPGFLPDACRFLPMCDLLVMPSLTEGLPITLLEAMRAGTPIVATRVGGIPHILQDRQSASIVPPADPGALAQAIAALHDRPDRGLALSKAALRLFQRNYTREQMAHGYHRIYKELLGEELLGPPASGRSSSHCQREVAP